MMIAKHPLNILTFILLMAFVFCTNPKPVEASLTISPLRVVLEGRSRSAEVMLLNLSKQTNTYRLGWIYNKMDETGHYTRVAESLTPDMDVAKYVVFSPRQVSIPPGDGKRSGCRYAARQNSPTVSTGHTLFSKNFRMKIPRPAPPQRLNAA